MSANLAGWAARHEVIVLEGCDGVGKTTLAGKLVQQHGYHLTHATRTPDGIDLAERYYNLLALPGRLVLDRSFISELVYGPLLHGRSRLTLAQARDLAAVVGSRGGLLVHVTAPPEVIADRLRRRDGIAPEITLLTAIVSSYDEVFAKLTTHAPTTTIVP
ncbi:AAA family ATPase [Actinomadura sp. 7K507]|uniref:AAA family ATPase n=1 Tax=Actinomadura sp. 7K507 TaxID=2530365 RepID=UPI0010479436|nr:AAA family ATPase [Actinomadura sp. 7K507]TDC91968.1 hypothetical protein E1285_12370 [Actinomadura sp. 7K507]